MWREFDGGALEFLYEVLSTKSLTVRLSCWNALNEYHRTYLPNGPNPFKDNPLPYPLLQKWVRSFSEVWTWTQSLSQPERGWACSAALLRTEWPDAVQDGIAFVEGRPIPLTDTAITYLTEPGTRPPRKGEFGKWLRGSGWSLPEIQGALLAELARRGVPEVTKAGLYGRWSAMKHSVSDGPRGLFRSRPQNPTGGPSRSA